MQKQNTKASETVDKNTSVVNNAIARRDVKAYEAPILISYGDVRDITLGGTLGFGESGAGFENFDVFRP